jgi:hypothetical protein
MTTVKLPPHEPAFVKQPPWCPLVNLKCFRESNLLSIDIPCKAELFLIDLPVPSRNPIDLLLLILDLSFCCHGCVNVTPHMRTNSLWVMGLPICVFLAIPARMRIGTRRMHTVIPICEISHMGTKTPTPHVYAHKFIMHMVSDWNTPRTHTGTHKIPVCIRWLLDLVSLYAYGDFSDPRTHTVILSMELNIIRHSQRLLLFSVVRIPTYVRAQKPVMFFLHAHAIFYQKGAWLNHTRQSGQNMVPICIRGVPVCVRGGKKKFRIWGVPLLITNLCAYMGSNINTIVRLMLFVSVDPCSFI